MKRILKSGICLIGLFTAAIHHGDAQNIKESTLWGPKGANWDSEGRLPDFSYAGYRSSENELPNIAQVYDLSNNTITGTKAKPNDGVNDAPFLQQLINAATNGGAIFIPAGRWNMDSDISMNKKGLVIRGAVNAAGVPTTEFYQGDPRFATPKTSGSVTAGIITMQGSQTFSAEIGKVSVNAKQGAKSITLTNVGTLAKGDFIRMVQYDPADGSLADFLTGGAYQGSETENQKDKFRWFAKVVSVSGKTLNLDRPLPIPANVKWNPTITEFNVAASVTEMGVENIQFTFNNKIEFDHLKFYGFSAITINKATNCWVKNVVIVDSESGIALTGESCFNTIRGVKFRDIQRAKVTLPLPGSADYGYKITQVGTGHHPLYFLSSHYNLVENFAFENIYWHEIGVEDHAQMNVYRNGKGVALAFDNHKLLPFSNLWTNIDAGVPARIFWNSGLNALDADGLDRRGVNAGIRNTYWNIQFNNSVHKIPAAPSGTAGFRSLNLVGIEGAKVNETSQFAELTSATDQVAQPDLFQAQLDRRNIVTNVEEEVLLDDVESISVFPNPSSNGTFMLSKECSWKVISETGKELLSGTGVVIDLSQNPKGVYLIKLNEKVERIVVE